VIVASAGSEVIIDNGWPASAERHATATARFSSTTGDGVSCAVSRERGDARRYQPRRRVTSAASTATNQTTVTGESIRKPDRRSSAFFATNRDRATLMAPVSSQLG
jgi:hypothetical protein